MYTIIAQLVNQIFIKLNDVNTLNLIHYITPKLRYICAESNPIPPLNNTPTLKLLSWRNSIVD